MGAAAWAGVSFLSGSERSPLSPSEHTSTRDVGHGVSPGTIASYAHADSGRKSIIALPAEYNAPTAKAAPLAPAPMRFSIEQSRDARELSRSRRAA